jgi:hypothetical protein
VEITIDSLPVVGGPSSMALPFECFSKMGRLAKKLAEDFATWKQYRRFTL